VKKYCLQIIAVIALVTTVLSTFSFVGRKKELSLLRQELATLRQEAESLAKLHAGTIRDLAALEKSRAEIDRLKALTDPNAEATLQAWLGRVHLLKEQLEKMPEKRIPELKYITEEDWLDITRTIKLESEFDFIEAFALLRLRSKCTAPVAGNIQIALAEYLDAHSGKSPSNISELRPYLHTPVDDEILNRYGIVYEGSTLDLPRNKILLQETQTVDDDYDNRLVITKEAMHFRNVSKNGDAVKQAIKAFAMANNQKPAKIEDLLPYLTVPLTNAQLTHHWSRNAARK
jgi:hypothetical protein